MTDTIIIGGGAAGLMTAITLKTNKPEASVTVLEANDRVGKKLALTGNGRCNISNENLSAERYHGDSGFAMRIIEKFGYGAQKEFFKALGVPFCVLEEGKAYPYSLQAGSVVDALRFKAEELGVKTVLNSRVTEVDRIDGGFEVSVFDKKYLARTVAVACGGKAGGNLGSDGGYAIFKKFGHKIEPLFPSLVQVKTTPETVRQLKGIKVNAEVAASSAAGTRVEFGEVLFCDYGLSGPPILQVSRTLNGEKPTVTLKLLPDIDTTELKKELEFRAKSFKNRPLSELFTGLLNKRLGQVVIKSVGLSLNDLCESLNDKKCNQLITTLKEMKFKVTGNTGFENSQVTAGGAQTAQFFDTLMSKKCKGLFAVGEVLNVDGDCGGFNLAFCWASGYAAANGIKEYLEC